jgi:protein-disulfide isomerase
MKRGIWLTGLICAVAAGGACSSGPGGGGTSTSADASKVAAEFEGQTVTLGELDASAKERLFMRETLGEPSRIYELRQEALDSWIEDHVLASEAKKRGVDVDTLIAQEVAKRGPVTDQDVAAFYDRNRARVQGRTLEQLAPDIRKHLESQREQEVRQALVEDAPVHVHLEPPHVSITLDGPSEGPADAPVTLVEFSDFQCPFCARARPMIQALREHYPTQLRVVYKHLPLEAIHPHARAAAEAAVCADEQGKFWAYHDQLFAHQSKLSDDDLRGYAAAVGLDLSAFEQCRKDPKRTQKVADDLAEARAAGITGTPAFVINGVLLRGLQPPDAMIARIDKDLGAAAPKQEASKTSP